jgi:hypothetical protein
MVLSEPQAGVVAMPMVPLVHKWLVDLLEQRDASMKSTPYVGFRHGMPTDAFVRLQRRVGQPPGSPFVGKALKQIPSKMLNVRRRRICPELFQGRTKALDACPKCLREIFGPSAIQWGHLRVRSKRPDEFNQDIKCSRAGPPRPSCQDLAKKGDCIQHDRKVAACVVVTDGEQHAVIAVLSRIVRCGEGESAQRCCNLTWRCMRWPLPFRQLNLIDGLEHRACLPNDP